MPKSIDASTRTIHLQYVGRHPAVEAQELAVGDTLMWNGGGTTMITAIVDASPKFLLITEKREHSDTVTERRLMKTRLVARVAQAAAAEKEDQALTEQRPVGATVVHELEDGTKDAVSEMNAPAADGTVLVDSRMGSAQESGHVTHGALTDSLHVPEVVAAVRVLKLGRQTLAELDGASRCVTNGAYLDPRQATGAVVLDYLRTDGPVPGERDRRGLRLENARILTGYADLFRGSRWEVEEYRETDPHDGENLVRLILTPPGPLPFGSRILRASDGRFGTVTNYGADLRMIITWDRAIDPDPRHYAPDELTTYAFTVFPAVTHCSGCGHVVNDDEIDDSYTTCCNEGACSGCALVNGTYRCGTEAPTGDE
jgi:hypothetical protein